MSDRDGVIASIQNNNTVGGDICDIHFDYGVGDAVQAFRVGPNRIGHVITKGKTLEEAVKVLDEALKNITIEVTEG
jgi:hypothetical protein